MNNLDFPKAQLNNEGYLNWKRGGTMDVNLNFDMYSYPFDSHIVNLKMENWCFDDQ